MCQYCTHTHTHTYTHTHTHTHTPHTHTHTTMHTVIFRAPGYLVYSMPSSRLLTPSQDEQPEVLNNVRLFNCCTHTLTQYMFKLQPLSFSSGPSFLPPVISFFFHPLPLSSSLVQMTIMTLRIHQWIFMSSSSTRCRHKRTGTVHHTCSYTYTREAQHLLAAILLIFHCSSGKCVRELCAYLHVPYA